MMPFHQVGLLPFCLEQHSAAVASKMGSHGLALDCSFLVRDGQSQVAKLSEPSVLSSVKNVLFGLAVEQRACGSPDAFGDHVQTGEPLVEQEVNMHHLFEAS